MAAMMIAAIAVVTNRRMGLRLLDSNGGAVDRQAAQWHPGCRIDRVAQSGWAGGCASLTNAAGMLGALDHVDVDRRHLINAQHSVVVEIRLPHAAFLERDLAPQRCGQ